MNMGAYLKAGARHRPPILIMLDMVRRNRAAFLFFAVWISSVMFLYLAVCHGRSALLFPLVMTCVAWAGCTYFYDQNRHPRLFYTTLPVSRRERGRALWFVRVVLMPSCCFGVNLFACLILLLVSGWDLVPITAFLAVALAGLMALSRIVRIPYTGLATPVVVGVAIAVILRLPPIPSFTPAAEAALLIAIIVSWLLAERLAIEEVREESKSKTAKEKPRPIPVWRVRVEAIAGRIWLLALYLSFFVHHLSSLKAEGAGPLPRDFTHLLVVALPAFGPFAFAGSRLFERFKMMRAVPGTARKIAFSIYGQALAGSAFAAGVTVFFVHKWSSEPLTANHYIQAWLLGVLVGSVVPPTTFKFYPLGAGIFIISLILVTLLVVVASNLPASGNPIMTILLFAAACSAFTYGLTTLRRSISRSDGHEMPGILDEIRHGINEV